MQKNFFAKEFANSPLLGNSIVGLSVGLGEKNSLCTRKKVRRSLLLEQKRRRFNKYFFPSSLCMFPIKKAHFSVLKFFRGFFAKIINDWEIPLQVSWGIRGRRGPSHIYLFYGEASSKKRRRRGRKRRYIVRKGVRGGFAKPFSRMVYARPGNWKKDFENRMGRRRSKNSFGFIDPIVGVPRGMETHGLL